jgi:hypothetical protein
MKFSLTLLILLSVCGLGVLYFGTINDYAAGLFSRNTVGVAGGMITRSLLTLPTIVVILYTVNRAATMTWQENWCFLIGKKSFSRWAFLVALCFLSFLSAVFSVLAFPWFGAEIDQRIFSVSLSGGAYFTSFLFFAVWNLLTTKRTPAPRTIFADVVSEKLYYPGNILPRTKMYVFSENREFSIVGMAILSANEREFSYTVKKVCRLSPLVFNDTPPCDKRNPLSILREASAELSECCKWASEESAFYAEFRERLCANFQSESGLFEWTGKTRISRKT